jgi:hypothetical protein
MLIDWLRVGPTPSGGKVRVGNICSSRFLLRAPGRGYSLAGQALGGLYRLHGKTLKRLTGLDFLGAMSKGQYGFIREEDVLIALGVKSVGDAVNPINDYLSSCPTYPCAGGSIPLTSEQLSSPGLLAVHLSRLQIATFENCCVR